MLAQRGHVGHVLDFWIRSRTGGSRKGVVCGQLGSPTCHAGTMLSASARRPVLNMCFILEEWFFNVALIWTITLLMGPIAAMIIVGQRSPVQEEPCQAESTAFILWWCAPPSLHPNINKTESIDDNHNVIHEIETNRIISWGFTQNWFVIAPDHSHDHGCSPFFSQKRSQWLDPTSARMTEAGNFTNRSMITPWPHASFVIVYPLFDDGIYPKPVSWPGE